MKEDLKETDMDSRATRRSIIPTCNLMAVKKNKLHSRRERPPPRAVGQELTNSHSFVKPTFC
jgi:hypothetical protein